MEHVTHAMFKSGHFASQPVPLTVNETTFYVHEELLREFAPRLQQSVQDLKLYIDEEALQRFANWLYQRSYSVPDPRDTEGTDSAVSRLAKSPQDPIAKLLFPVPHRGAIHFFCWEFRR